MHKSISELWKPGVADALAKRAVDKAMLWHGHYRSEVTVMRDGEIVSFIPPKPTEDDLLNGRVPTRPPFDF